MFQSWDPELALVAQAHADQCKFAHDCAECRRVERFGVGQNLYIYKQTVRLAATDWERAVTDWYDEVELFSNRKVKPFKFSAEYGHYTALAWATTDKVGCGASSYREGRWLTTLYTCNYGPAGNFINGQMYVTGPACSQCQPGDRCSSQYPGLCTSPRLTLAANTSTTTPAPPPPPPPPTTTTPPSPLPQTTTAITSTVRSTTSRKRPSWAPPTPAPTFPTSARPVQREVMLSCAFDDVEESCEVRDAGVAWQKETDRDTGNTFYSTQLVYRDKTDLILNNLLPPPTTGNVICVSFKYKKYSLGRRTER